MPHYINKEADKKIKLQVENTRIEEEMRLLQFSKANLEELHLIRHDIKNQYSCVKLLLEEKKYAEVMVLEYNGKKKSNAAKLPLNALFAKDYSGLDNIGDNDEFYEVNDEALFQGDGEIEELTLDENLNEVAPDGEDEDGTEDGEE